MEEEDLIEEARITPQVFARIVDRYYDLILNYIYKRTLDRDLSFDLTQQTFLKAFLNLEKFRKNREIPYSHYLLKLATNEVNMYLRKRKETLGIDPDIWARFSSFEKDSEENETRELIYRALEKLSPRHQSVIFLRYFQELSPREVARVLGVSEVACRVITHRALQKLKKEIEVMERETGIGKSSEHHGTEQP